MQTHFPPLPKRLACAAELVPQCGRAVDIGTDHALLPIWLILSGRAGSALCADISPMPLIRAEKNIEKYCPGIPTVLSDGFENISCSREDCVIIAGMGGETIAGILRAGTSSGEAGAYVLQPMSKAGELRRYLADSGFSIKRWSLVKDRGRIYECLLAQKQGEPEKNDIFFHAGRPDGQPKELYAEYIYGVIRSLHKERDGLMRSSRTGSEEKIAELNRIAEGLAAVSG